MSLSIVILGLSITSSWGNGHATTYRSLVKGLALRGHDVLFLERDMPWYAANRDCPAPAFCQLGLYDGLDGLRAAWGDAVAEADVVIVGSFVPDGVAVGDWVIETARGVRAFYDIDTPVTLAALAEDACAYLSPRLAAAFDLYLSFTGGPVLERIERLYGICARPLYCSVDADVYAPDPRAARWDLGYMGTYSADRQPKLDRLLLTPARAWRGGRFIAAGPQYPRTIRWPGNVDRIEHLSPRAHRTFYTAQRFTLNVTRADMVAAGWSPSVRLFEAAACGTPIISDWWAGLDEVFAPCAEVLVAQGARDVLGLLHDLPDADAARIGRAARQRVLAEHTAPHRARQLEGYVAEIQGSEGARHAG